MTTIDLTDQHQFEGFRPQLRGDVEIRRYGDEAVAVTPHGGPLYLDPVAALLVQVFDGEASAADLIADVCDAVGVPEVIARNQVRRVVSQLHEARMLDVGADGDAAPERVRLDYFPAPPNP